MRFELFNSSFLLSANNKLIAIVVYNTAQIGPITHPGGWKNGSYSELNVKINTPNVVIAPINTNNK